MWWIEKTTDQMQKAAKSPGANWVEIPGATDSMTQKQAQQQLLNDIAHGDLGYQLPNIPNPLTGTTHNIEQWVIRGFEMLLGIGLIIVALAKLAADTPAGRAAVKAGKVAAIL